MEKKLINYYLFCGVWTKTGPPSSYSSKLKEPRFIDFVNSKRELIVSLTTLKSMVV